jgi:PD-(D/E)XK nuclease superfamily
METNVNNSNYRGCRTSALEAVKRCPFSVQKVYRDKFKGFIAQSALRGSVVHDALEDYGTHCLEQRCATDFEYWDSIIYKYAASVPSEVYQETIDILKDCKEFINYSILLDAKIACIEERFYLDEGLNIIDPPAEGETAYFSSAIDYYMIEHDDKTANVYDYKTSRKIYSQTVMKTKLQKDYYPFLIFQKYPDVEVINFYFEFARYGVLTEPIIITRENDYDRLRQQLVADIANYYEVVDDPNDREARPSGFCQLCEVRGICPSVRNALPEDVLITDEFTAVEAARQLKALQIKMKQVKESLETYLNNKKNIEISDTEGFGIQQTTKESVFDLYHLVLDLDEAKVPPGKVFDALKLTKAAFLKLIKGTTIPKEKYLVAKQGTKIGFYDLEEEQEEEESNE